MDTRNKFLGKYKYTPKNEDERNEFFEGIEWWYAYVDECASTCVRLLGYSSGTESENPESPTTLIKKAATISRSRFEEDFSKAGREQDIKPEFKAAEEKQAEECRPHEGRGAMQRHLPGNGREHIWSDSDIADFMSDYDVDASLLWSDEEANRHVKRGTGRDGCRHECRGCGRPTKPAKTNEECDPTISSFISALSALCDTMKATFL